MALWLHILVAVVVGLLSAIGLMALVIVVNEWFERHRWDGYG